VDFGDDGIDYSNEHGVSSKYTRAEVIRAYRLTPESIPVWVQIRGRKLTVVDRHRADYVLVDVQLHTPGLPQGPHIINKNGMSVFMKVIRCEDLDLFYIKVGTDVSQIPPIIKRAMSAMYSIVENYDFSDFDGTQYLRRVFDVDGGQLRHCGEVPRPTPGEFPRDKITAEHHTHMRPEEIWDAAKQAGENMRPVMLVLKKLRKIAGVTEAVVSTFMLYAACALYQVAVIVSTSKAIWAAKSIEELAAVLKELATPLKSMHNSDIKDYTQLFELQSLVNRGVGGVKWNDEYNHRVKPDVVDISPEDVYRHAKDIFIMGATHGFKYPKMSWDRYVSSRWEWVPSGSVHSQHTQDIPYIVDEYRHKTKFVTLNMMPDKHVSTMLGRPPQIHAWASVKYEWAKQRAIYGVDVTSSTITNFAMYRCEEVFKHRFPVGEEAAAERVHKRLNMMLRDSESCCYDFDDFNAQHSTESMKAVLRAYRDAFRLHMSEDQLIAIEWVIASLDDITIHNSMGGPAGTYKPKGTLLSGWRLTTFMNTALNFIYFKHAGVFDIAGVEDSVHNGDDVLLAVRSLKCATQLHYRMASINARAQPAKCNVFSVGEFLRVEHKISKEKGLGAQYLTRSCATSVHSRIESQEPTRFLDSLKATMTRAEDLLARSRVAPDLIRNITHMCLERASEAFGISVKLAEMIADSHYVVGGCKSGPFDPVDNLFEEHVLYEELEETDDRGKRRATTGLLSPGITAYARRLAQLYEGYVDEQDIRSRIVAATRRQLAVTRETWLEVTPLSERSRYVYGRALYRMYRGIVNIPHIQKARFAGVHPIALLDSKISNTVRSIMASVADVDYALRVLL
jgi:hypothetical protein